MDILNLTKLISERAVPPLTPLPITHLGYYDQLRHHRCLITHGILTVALGNIAHLQRTQRRLGHDDLSDPASLAAVQDAMLRDQASEPSPDFSHVARGRPAGGDSGIVGRTMAGLGVRG